MRRFVMIATLVLLIASSISQAKASPLATSCSHLKKSSEENRHETADDNGVGISSAWSGRTTPGLEFLGRIDKRIVKEFENAWRESLDGSSDREGVVLMFRLVDGSYFAKSQGFTNQYRRFTFGWNPAALAIVHTHPNGCDPKPSEQDRSVADQLDVPILTISIHGMYVYEPTTKKTSKILNGLDWLDLSKLTEEISRARELAHMDP